FSDRLLQSAGRNRAGGKPDPFAFQEKLADDVTARGQAEAAKAPPAARWCSRARRRVVRCGCRRGSPARRAGRPA
ncbi:hypothetical protein EN962_22425, partial [Mesorhizobium sp. M7A.F.Ca.CA.001.09.2.1]